MLIRPKDTENNEVAFTFMINHLARGNAKNRQKQARGPHDWARNQTESSVAIGDDNFNFGNLCRNQSMAMFARNEPNENKARFVWRWAIPDQIA